MWGQIQVLLTFPPLNSSFHLAPIWRTDHANHIGSTAIWPWQRTDEKETGILVFNAAARTPLIARNGSHLVAEVGYSESSFSISNTFWDLIGLPNARLNFFTMLHKG